MDLQYLQEFVVLEQIRNFTQAADALYTTEATLSRHIKALEKELDEPLFQRTTRRIDLTDFGRKFLVYAQKITNAWEECETNLLKKDALVGDRLIIGIFGPVSHYAFFQSALQKFSALNIGCTTGTIKGDLTQLKEKLRKREYDISLVREDSPTVDDEFGRLPVFQEPLCVVLPKDDPLAEGETVDVLSLKGKTVTLPSEFMLIHRLFVDLCRHNDFEPKIQSLLREREFFENFVSLGNRIAVLCEHMANHFVNPQTQVVKKLSPLTYEYINLLYRKEDISSPLLQDALRCFGEASK